MASPQLKPQLSIPEQKAILSIGPWLQEDSKRTQVVELNKHDAGRKIGIYARRASDSWLETQVLRREYKTHPSKAAVTKLRIARTALHSCGLARESYVLSKVAEGHELQAAQIASWRGLEGYTNTLLARVKPLPQERLLEEPLLDVIEKYRVKPRDEFTSTDMFVTIAGLTAVILASQIKTNPLRLIIPTPNVRQDILQQWAFDPTINNTIPS